MQYWVWVSDQQSYLDEFGNDRPELDPESPEAEFFNWTCHKETEKGDLILLYRSRVKKDIAYLVQATGDAQRSLDRRSRELGWNFNCDCSFVFKFAHPMKLSEIKADPYLQDWTALRGNFQQMAYRIEDHIWARLTSILANTNRGYKSCLRQLSVGVHRDPVISEQEIEEMLVQNLRRFKKLGFDLELCSEEVDGYFGRQVVCDGGHGGRIDLLCYDRKEKRYVVIEIKNVPARQETYGQILTYMGWVQNTIRPRRRVWGIVVSRGRDARFEACMKTSAKVKQFDLSDLGFE